MSAACDALIHEGCGQYAFIRQYIFIINSKGAPSLRKTLVYYHSQYEFIPMWRGASYSREINSLQA